MDAPVPRSTGICGNGPGEFVEPTTIGLKVRNGEIKRLIIQPLTGTLVAASAQL